MHYPDQKKQRMSFQMTPASKAADEAEKKE